MVYTLDDIGNAPGQAYDFLKRKYVSLTKPDEDGNYSSRKAAIARQEKLAEMLSQMGAQEQAVSTAGGITAPVSPMSALARGLTSFGGAYMSGKAAADEAALEKEEREAAREGMKSFYELPEKRGLVTSEVEGTKPYQATFQAPTLPGMPAPEAVTAELQMPVGPQTEAGMIPGGPRSRADQVRMANEFALGDNKVLARMAPALLAQTKPQFEGIGARGTMDTNPDSPTYRQVIGAPTEKTDFPTSVEEFQFAQTPAGGNFKGDYNQFLDRKTKAGRNVTEVNVGPTGIDYGKPEDGLVWARSPNGTVKLDERGAPIAIPYQGGKAYLTKETTEAASREAASNASTASSIVRSDIANARSIMKKSEMPVTGIIGSATKGIPGTQSRVLSGLLTTIKANIGFDKLQKMRAASPTGAALGPVSDFENRLLQAVVGDLEQSTTDEQLDRNLKRLDEEIYKIVDNSGKPVGKPGAYPSTSSGTTRRGRYDPTTGKVVY
jgi:hypothetical protein